MAVARTYIHTTRYPHPAHRRHRMISRSCVREWKFSLGTWHKPAWFFPPIESNVSANTKDDARDISQRWKYLWNAADGTMEQRSRADPRPPPRLGNTSETLDNSGTYLLISWTWLRVTIDPNDDASSIR